MDLKLEQKNIDKNKTVRLTIDRNNFGYYIVPEFTRGGICVDIGCNVGCFTKAYHEFFKKIYFYEPQLECYEICQSFQFKNALGYNEAVYCKKDQKLNMVAHSSYHSGSSALSTDSINSDWQKNEIINEVNTVDLETILERANGVVDYMKLDCETSEYYLLINKDLSNIKCIGMEIHCQMGQDRYDSLLEHIEITHKIYGDKAFNAAKNKEILCVNHKYVKTYESQNVKTTDK